MTVPLPMPRPADLKPPAGLTITYAQLRAMCPHGNKAIMQALAPALTEILPLYGINTPLRVCHFLAQAAHETDGFRTLVEYASGDAYDTRTDLGNTPQRDGDGRKYKGRGIFQCTGRANYARYGAMLGIDLVNNPTWAADPVISVKIACLYWNDRSMSIPADRDDILTCSIKVNGRNRKTGLPNGYEDRKAKLALAKKQFGIQ